MKNSANRKSHFRFALLLSKQDTLNGLLVDEEAVDAVLLRQFRVYLRTQCRTFPFYPEKKSLFLPFQPENIRDMISVNKTRSVATVMPSACRLARQEIIDKRVVLWRF